MNVLTLDFCGLNESVAFSKSLDNFSFVDTGGKWTRHLSESQQDTLNDVLAGHLKKYGYAGD